MNKFARFILSPFKHIIGLSYGKCGCCGFHWNCVNRHVVQLNNYHGVFAVCEDCWKNKSYDEIITAYQKLYDDWLLGDKYNKPSTVKEIGITRKELIDAVKRDLKNRAITVIEENALTVEN